VKENFGEFNVSLQICQSFTCQFLIASEIVIEAGHKFAKDYFTKCNLANNSPKFSQAKASLRTVFELLYSYNINQMQHYHHRSKCNKIAD